MVEGKFYTGVGSRKTPKEIQDEMNILARILSLAKFTLRSGGADGADKAFSEGCKYMEGKMDIFLPWSGFNNNCSPLIGVNDKALKLAESILGPQHWSKCSGWARKLHARNCYQVLGQDLATPSRFLICWTPEGDKIGGTATAIKLADRHNIPVFNLAISYDRKELAELLLYEARMYFLNRTLVR